MIKILFIIPSFIRGGVERVTLNILNLLDPDLFDITLIICVKGSNELTNNLNKNINVIKLEKSNVRQSSIGIIKQLNKINPDIVFTSFVHLNVFVLLHKIFLFKKYKTVVRLNSLPSNKLKSNWRSYVYDLVFSKLINTSNIIISQSNEMTTEISKYFKIDLNKIYTIQNPIDIDNILKNSKFKSEISFDKEYFNLIAIGSLSEIKGFHLLIEALYILNSKGVNDIRLYIVGDNRDINVDYKLVLSNLVSRLNLNDVVYFLGLRKNPYNLLNESDAFVLSSIKEGFPNVVLEALTLGVPCVVTNCVDLTKFITPNTGVIVEKNSANALAEGIIQIKNVKGQKSKFTNFDFNNFFLNIVRQ